MDYITKGSHLLVALANTHFDISIEDKLHILAASMQPKISFEGLKRLILGDKAISIKHIKSLQSLGVKMGSSMAAEEEEEEEEVDEEEEAEEEEEEKDETSTPSPISG